MLDFAPDGLEEISQVTRYLAGTAVAVLAMLVAVGFLSFLMGRNGGLSRSQERGMKMVGLGLASVMLLTSVSAAVSWGISQGGSDMMPSEARQQDLVVEREAPQTTCTDEAVRNFNQEPSPLSQQEREDMLETVSKGDLMVVEGNGGIAFHERAENSDAAFVEDSEVEELTVLRWYPDGAGGNCGGENTNSTVCTDMEVEAVLENGDDYAITHEIVGPDGNCSD